MLKGGGPARKSILGKLAASYLFVNMFVNHIYGLIALC
jgi:hypothetical protein